jgi:hypothetical protein
VANGVARITSRNTPRGLSATKSTDKMHFSDVKLKTKALRFKAKTKGATIDFNDGQPLASHREP